METRAAVELRRPDSTNATGALALYERVGLRVFRQSNTWERAQ